MLIAGRLARGGDLRDGWIEIEGAWVAALGDGPPPRSPDERVEGLIAPGFVDLQVNGAAGHEVRGGTEALDAIDGALLARGVTSYLPTLVSPTAEEADALLGELERRAADPASPVAGIHVEGPFISPAHPGMHPPGRLRQPSGELPAWLTSPAIRIVTIAPELEGSLTLIRALRRRGVVVALGHSGASAAQALAAVDAGAGLVTHLFNAMAALDHREPRLAGVGLADSRLLVSVIADGLHVHPLVLELVRRSAPARVVLISDASPAAAAPPGRYALAGVTIEGGTDGAVRTADGRLAGSSLTLDEAVRRWASLTGATIAEAIRAGGELPARLLGLPTALDPGGVADLVVLDRAGLVGRVMRRGRWLSAR
jgi:N-acetylglucosamine-6-phosphate deacetylase